MAGKRKASAAFEETDTPRHTRSSGPTPEYSTPSKVKRTYGKRAERTPAKRRAVPDDEQSDDELMLSPSKTTRSQLVTPKKSTRPTAQSPARRKPVKSDVDEEPSPSVRRSGRLSPSKSSAVTSAFVPKRRAVSKQIKVADEDEEEPESLSISTRKRGRPKRDDSVASSPAKRGRRPRDGKAKADESPMTSSARPSRRTNDETADEPSEPEERDDESEVSTSLTSLTLVESALSDLDAVEPFDSEDVVMDPLGSSDVDECLPETPHKPRARAQHRYSSPLSTSGLDLTTFTSRSSPSKSPVKAIQKLPERLHSCLSLQKRAVLRALHKAPPIEQADSEDEEERANDVVYKELSNLIHGTVSRGEGNSCLVIGPRGSGKTSIVNRCLSEVEGKPIILRLSAWVQQSDRHAMVEIANQLSKQTGANFLSSDDEDDVPTEGDTDNAHGTSFHLPPSSQLPALISQIPSLPRPTIIILDAFDLFALHPRQSLLYCLLDTAQACRGGVGSRGMAVVGVTTRVDTLNLLEKRVKSRFSGRMLRTAGPCTLPESIAIMEKILLTELTNDMVDDNAEEWKTIWSDGIRQFLADKEVRSIFNDTFGITRDVNVYKRILTSLLLQLSPTKPVPNTKLLAHSIETQRSRPPFPFLQGLPYASLCLLVASFHQETKGQETFNFEQLHEAFRDQVKASQSAPIQVKGASIGMNKCDRAVLMGAFEHLVAIRVFVNASANTSTTAKQFVKYRCAVERSEIKRAIEQGGTMPVRKWLTKAQ